MIETRTETIIHKPIGIVFQYLFSLENQTEYNTSIKSAIRNPEVSGSPPSFTIEIDLALFKLTEVYRVTKFDRERFFIARCDHSLLSFEDRYDFEEIDGGTLVKIYDRMDLKGLLRWSEGLVKINIATQMQENLMRVKSNLEKNP
jgi:hypothetical protein